MLFFFFFHVFPFLFLFFLWFLLHQRHQNHHPSSFSSSNPLFHSRFLSSTTALSSKDSSFPVTVNNINPKSRREMLFILSFNFLSNNLDPIAASTMPFNLDPIGDVIVSNMDQPPQNQNGEKPLAVAAPQNLHQSDADEDDDNVKQLDECSALYLLMQDCIVRSNRNWKECQKEIQALKECSQKRNKNKGT